MLQPIVSMAIHNKKCTPQSPSSSPSLMFGAQVVSHAFVTWLLAFLHVCTCLGSAGPDCCHSGKNHCGKAASFSAPGNNRARLPAWSASAARISGHAHVAKPPRAIWLYNISALVHAIYRASGALGGHANVLDICSERTLALMSRGFLSKSFSEWNQLLSSMAPNHQQQGSRVRAEASP